ncbi:hypothetical protein F5J12DRAFT_323015 [Pisolithus orientalis]|uniref:uncharacterized protein n=1 Tax=Pisolithus orientalis TaxID=936130 RepID=UPI00222559DF|nr:uncharacterized protein F5J12DRAFT_323015 [Pisolithus orientalis]KAI5998331.1 hypothetical protein F5J12DRAFT_323015 [Pisolithus orientalis]
MANATTTMLLHEHESSRQYSVRDFLRIARTQPAATVGGCDLYYIPSRSSCYHEFLLVHIHVDRETLMVTIERSPSNNGMQVISSNGGVARDTITVVRARENHEYWQRVGQDPVLRGTLRWDRSPPHPFNITFFASAASTTFKHYNLYVRQCYWYARVTLAAMERAFPPCSREGTTSFSRRWFSMFGSYKPSQVQLLVDLHTIACQGLPICRPPTSCDPHHGSRTTCDCLRHTTHSPWSFHAYSQLPEASVTFGVA